MVRADCTALEVAWNMLWRASALIGGWRDPCGAVPSEPRRPLPQPLPHCGKRRGW